MGAALAKLADRDLGEGPEQEGYDRARVQPLADDFDHFVRHSFGAVRASAATSPLAARMFLERLNGVRLGATSAQRHEILVTEAGALVEQAELELKGPALKEVRETMRQLFQTL